MKPLGKGAPLLESQARLVVEGMFALRLQEGPNCRETLGC